MRSRCSLRWGLAAVLLAVSSASLAGDGRKRIEVGSESARIVLS